MVFFPLANSIGFYEYTFMKYGTSDLTGYSQGELARIADHIVRYLFSNFDNFYFEIDGKPVFSNQAIIHMADVKELLVLIQYVIFGIFILFIGLAIYIYIKRKEFKDILFKYSLITFSVFMVIILIFLIICLIDFTFAFQLFHRIIFPSERKFQDAFFGDKSNYSELPGVENTMLIKILSNNYFIDFAIIVTVITVVVLGLYLLFTYLYKKKNIKEVISED